jgi:hypothetical protein
MSLDRQYGRREMGCDGCGQCREPDNVDRSRGAFERFIAETKAEGWRIIRDPAGEWMHYCADCEVT